MKKNRMMRAASALLVAVLLTTCTISGTFAKYVTEGSANDSARVAKWGVQVTAAADAFAEKYDTDDGSVSGTIAKSVVSVAADNDAVDDKVIAPGTEGNLGSTSITGTPEVAVNVKKVATLELTDWEVTGDWDSDPNTPDDTVEYCPIVFKVNGTEIKMDATNNTIAKLIAAVKAAIECDKNYPANTPLSPTDDVTVTWAWPFDGDDAKDTALGNLPVAPKIGFELTTTVTQID